MKRSARAVALTVLLILVAAWSLWPADGVPILAYHKVGDSDEPYSVAPADFDAQMRWLAAEGYTAISLFDLIYHMTWGTALPPKPIVITFDDGYADNLYNALPILEKHGMKATVFVITDRVGRDVYLNWKEIRELKARGTEIGSHTLAHRALTDLPPAERLQDARSSKDAIEWQIEYPVFFLAYPYGRADAAAMDTVKQAGYLGACGTKPGLNKRGDNIYALKRINIPRSDFGIFEFRMRLLRANIYARLGI